MKTCAQCGKQAGKLIRARCRSCYDRLRRPPRGHGNRLCSYCGGIGHNTRGCPKRLSDELPGMSHDEVGELLTYWLAQVTSSISKPRRLLLAEVLLRLRLLEAQAAGETIESAMRAECRARVENIRLREQLKEMANDRKNTTGQTA